MNHIRVFIYGSLLPGLSNRHIVEPYIVSSVPGRVEGRLVDLGPYPALVRTKEKEIAGASVRGCWIEITREGLVQMDLLEGFGGVEEDNDYDRIWAIDLDNPQQQGWVYVWHDERGLPFIECDYWPEYFAAKRFRSYE